LDAEPQPLGAQSLHDETARHEIERTPGQRDFARLDIDLVPLPRDACDANRRQQRALRAFDRQMSEAFLDGAPQHVIERGLTAEKCVSQCQRHHQSGERPYEPSPPAAATPWTRFTDREVRRVRRQNESPTEKWTRTLSSL